MSSEVRQKNEENNIYLVLKVQTNEENYIYLVLKVLKGSP